jgi:hypothetical protein
MVGQWRVTREKAKVWTAKLEFNEVVVSIRDHFLRLNLRRPL